MSGLGGTSDAESGIGAQGGEAKEGAQGSHPLQ